MPENEGASAQDGGASGKTPAPGSSPAPAEGTSAGAPSPGQVPTGAPAESGTEGTPSVADLQARADAAERDAKKARDEAAKWRRQLREREGAEDEAKTARLTGQERLEQERQKLATDKEAFERERLEFNLMQNMVKLGPKLNLIDPVDTLWLLDWEKIEWDDEGQPTNLEPLTRDLVAEKTYLVRKESPPAPPTAPTIGASAGSAPGPVPALTAEELQMAQATGMDPARYARMKEVKTLDDYKKITPGPQAPAGPPSATG